MSLSTVRETGFLEVAKKREDEPVKIYYELHGEGPEKVVLVMGLNSSCFSWEYQTKHLTETGRYTVLIFDNRGMGMSGIVDKKKKKKSSLNRVQ
jgi:pimeloyl-ACP methyl ester carboxylesterase